MTDLVQLARDTLAEDKRRSPGRSAPVRREAVLAQHVLDLREAIEAADALADHYGHVWVKDEKFYAYKDARAALAEKEPRIKRAGEKHEDRGVPRYDHP